MPAISSLATTSPFGLLDDLRGRVRAGRVPLGSALEGPGCDPIVWARESAAVTAGMLDPFGLGAARLAEATIVVVTPHAECVGWLLDRLEALVRMGDDPRATWHRLAEAAYWYQEDEPDARGPEGLLEAILDEAERLFTD
jgi:hypothetical protein